jgi:hypothetical protein
MTAEHQRLQDTHSHSVPWKKWGPYLSDRQWGTVREDYSPREKPGTISPMSNPNPVLIAGAKTGCWAFLTKSSGSALV